MGQRMNRNVSHYASPSWKCSKKPHLSQKCRQRTRLSTRNGISMKMLWPPISETVNCFWMKFHYGLPNITKNAIVRNRMARIKQIKFETHFEDFPQLFQIWGLPRNDRKLSCWPLIFFHLSSYLKLIFSLFRKCVESSWLKQLAKLI